MTHKGEPAISFTVDEIATVAQLFNFALVGKFSKDRLLMEVVRKFFFSLDLKETVTVGLLDGRHELICMANEADFIRVWTRSIWYVSGCPMRVFKWTPTFHVDK